MSQNPSNVVNPVSTQPIAPQIDILPGARTLYEILYRVPENQLENALSAAQIEPTSEIVNEVLKLSYSAPSSAVKFFRWAGLSLKHNEFSWNLIVDLLGKNQLFEKMWDAIRSMKQEEVLSMAAFLSVFESYCVAGRIGEAFMTFEVMERYGVQPNTFAVNSLLSAICRENNKTSKAAEFFERIKTKISPDADTFAILLEGWEKEGNAKKAKTTFGEMVIRVGWNPQYMPAYDAFLNTLIRGSQADETLKFLHVMKGKNCLPGFKFFSNAINILINQNDSVRALMLWDLMVDSGLIPNLSLYNSMIGLLCDNNNYDNAFRLLDDMAYHGAFADSTTYNMIFECLVLQKKVDTVGKFFAEMIKNECPPTSSNCAKAIAMLFNGDDPEAAIEIWNYMVDYQITPIDDSSNALLIGLCNMARLSELKRYAYKMLDNRIKIHKSTMEKLENVFSRDGRTSRDTYDHLERKWKSALD